MIFDMFSKRKKFEYHLNERIMLYMGFLGPVLKFLRCRCFNYDNMIRVNRMFNKAKDYLDEECDIIDIMNSVRKSNNFNQTFLTREQKILLRNVNNNIINEIHSDKESESEEEVCIDEQIAKNLSSSNTIVVMFTIGKLVKILKRYTQ